MTSLALLYNDSHVLENHHLALAFNIINNKAYNVFAAWKTEERRRARKLMIASVLATDMEMHASLQAELVRRSSGSAATAAAASSKKFDLGCDKAMLFQCVLHAADISNPTRRFATSASISMLAITEFNQQAVAEAAQGLPVTAHMVALDHAAKCKGEAGFAQFVARPYFAALLNCFPATDTASQLLQTIDDNVERWKAQALLPSLQLQ